MIRPMEKVVTSGCYEGTSRAGSFAVRGTASAPIFLFANRNRNSKIRIVSVEQLESAILELSPEERRRLVAWLDDHRNELFTAAETAQLTPAQLVQHAALRKPPIVLEADSALVIRTLESHMNQPQPA